VHSSAFLLIIAMGLPTDVDSELDRHHGRLATVLLKVHSDLTDGRGGSVVREQSRLSYLPAPVDPERARLRLRIARRG
jgi:hypothetical protein